MPDAAPKLSIQRDRSSLTLTLNDPATRNALSFETTKALIAAFAEAEADDKIKLILLQASPESGAFLSGGDLKAMDRMSTEDAKTYQNLINGVYAAFLNSSKLVVAAIDGPCYGGGMSIASLADLRIGTERARFCIPAARIGIAYSVDSTRRLIALVGSTQARMLLLTAKTITAAEALRINFLSELVASSDLEAELAALQDRVDGFAPLALRGMKRIMTDIELAQDAGLSAEQRAEHVAILQRCRSSLDHREGVRAFAERRKPQFTGV